MKKTKLTLEEHREMGGVLEAFRNERLIHFVVAISNATSKSSPQTKAAQKALKALDDLRSAMDDLVYKDYFDEIGDAFMAVYYCAGDRAKKSRKGSAK